MFTYWFTERLVIMYNWLEFCVLHSDRHLYFSS